MIPQQRIQPLASPAAFLGARASADIGWPLDYEDGGIALQDPSAGLLYQQWTGRLLDGTTITLQGSNMESPTTWLTGAGITEFSFTFDQNMKPAVAFVEGGVAKLNWFDVTVNQQVTTSFGDSVKNPRVSLDDKHRLASATSDVIFAYLRNGNLYYRQQRDRYLVEYPLATFVAGRLNKIGMNVKNRFQFGFIVQT